MGAARLLIPTVLATLAMGVGTLVTVLPASASVEAPDQVLAAGVVADRGDPVADADVLLQIWPNDGVLAQLDVGDPVPVLVLPPVRTDSGGRFEITGAVPATHRGPDGRIDAHLVVGDRTREIQWSYTALPPRGDSAHWSPAARDGNAPPGAGLSTRVDLGRGTAWEASHDPATYVGDSWKPLGAELRADTARVAVGPRSAAWRQFASLSRPTLMAPTGHRDVDRLLVPSAGATPADDCIYTFIRSVPDRRERFVTVYSWSHGKGRVIQSTGNQHTLGVGFKTAAGWSAGGSNTKSFGASASQSGIVNKAVYNRINYRDYNDGCGRTIRRPHSYADLISETASVSHRVFGAYCAVKAAGYRFTTSNAKNVTYSGGVDIGPLNVMAQAGYDNGVDLHFVIRAKSFVCGTNPDGLVHSSQISVSSYW